MTVKNIAIGIGIVAVSVGGYLVYKALAKPTEECIEGEVKCVGNDLYQCSDGDFQLIKKDATECTTPVDCSTLSETECKSAFRCRWYKPEETPTVFKCLSTDDYPYVDTIMKIAFRTRASKREHDAIYHPKIKLKTLDGIGVKTSYCGVNRASRIYFDLGQKIFVQNITGKIKIGGYDRVSLTCPPFSVDCYINVGFYFDDKKIAYKKYRVGSDIDLSVLPPIGEIGQRLIIDIEQITELCCKTTLPLCFSWRSPPYFAWGKATFICGII